MFVDLVTNSKAVNNCKIINKYKQKVKLSSSLKNIEQTRT